MALTTGRQMHAADPAIDSEIERLHVDLSEVDINLVSAVTTAGWRFARCRNETRIESDINN